MLSKSLALTIGAAAAFQTITIKEDGQPKTLYIVGGDWYTPKGGDTMDIPHNGRSYLATSDSIDPDNFYGLNMLGGSIAYDVDLSQSGCSCNAALYLTSMPGLDEDGHTSPENGYYCDAAGYGGIACPDFDIMEANTYAWQTTPHKCDSPSDKGHFSKCDMVGNCFQIAKQKLDGIYGPGDQNEINTLLPFHVKISFEETGHFQVEMTQNGKTHTMESDKNDPSCTSYMD